MGKQTSGEKKGKEEIGNSIHSKDVVR